MDISGQKYSEWKSRVGDKLGKNGICIEFASHDYKPEEDGIMREDGILIPSAMPRICVQETSLTTMTVNKERDLRGH